MRTMKSIKNLMKPNIKEREIKSTLKIIEGLMKNIVDEISCNKDIVVNMMDLITANEYTFYHSVNVCVLSLVLGAALKLRKKQLYLLGIASLLHDIGKIYTPKQILDKPSKLTYEEFEIIKLHSENGYRYVKKYLDIHTKVSMGIYQHHERYDGTGYPLKRYHTLGV